MTAGRGLDTGLDAMVQDLWERTRPLALERIRSDLMVCDVAAVLIWAAAGRDGARGIPDGYAASAALISASVGG
jgi:predicted component of type VI protein secretion system